MIMKDEELCEKGEQLWNATDIHNENSYKNYLVHILQCSECQDKLDLKADDLKDIKKHWKSLGVI